MDLDHLIAALQSLRDQGTPGDTPVSVPYLEWRSVFEDGPYNFAGEPRIIGEAMGSGYDPDRRYLSGGNETIAVIGNLTD